MTKFDPNLPVSLHFVGLGFWASKALLSAVEMELFTELAKHPGDLATLQARLNLHPRSARDFLDALAQCSTLGKLLFEVITAYEVSKDFDELNGVEFNFALRLARRAGGNNTLDPRT